jgi:hypothetical protein
MIRILYASSVGSCRGGACGWTAVAACFTMALPLARRWVAEHGLVLTTPLTSVALLKREAGIWLLCRRPRWNLHRGLSA